MGDADHLPPPAQPLREQPLTLGRYILLRELGEGAMGVVYAAYDEELDRKVALKLIHPAGQGNSELRGRIKREAQALARVSAPNVVQVYQVGEVEGQLFIAMEFVNGTTLAKWQAEPERSWQDILHMYLAAGQGLLAAHQAELVHRDFKPDNVLLGADQRPRVADFGLARIEGQTGAGPGAGSRPPATVAADAAAPELPTSLTQTGMVIGTPLYMSPEQHLGDPTDSRSDQFSFCVALYEALYRQMPFAGTALQELAVNTLKGNVLPRPPGSRVPIPVHEALLRGLSRLPGQRFASMRELLAALAFDPKVDRAAGPGSRRRVTLSMVGLSLTAVMGVQLLSLIGVSAFAASVLTALAYFLVFVFLAIRFRREWQSNTFHRGTLAYGLVFSGQTLALRGLGAVLALTTPQLVVLDLLTLAGTSCMVTALILPSLWPLVPLNCLGALAAALLPAYAQGISSASLAFTVIAATFRWNRVVGTRRGPRS